ncbi:cell wall metabolism sensor histidine kinase WalK [Ferrimicrobium sp.]|uniref:sensor histidine kinase n=1 Tax=Ferrimicrobium sp. TaxID=2926050 RepID=UPI00261D6740|nr:HAMP domain-containing sensor histidine kinase [Ferrimicrobium sp.]
MEKLSNVSRTQFPPLRWVGRQLASVRKRTTIAATVVVGLVLMAAFVGVALTLRAALTRNVVNTAKNEADDIVLLVRDGHLPNPLPIPRGDLAAQVVSSQGTVIAYSPNLKGAKALRSPRGVPSSGIVKTEDSARANRLAINGNVDHHTVFVADQVQVPTFLVGVISRSKPTSDSHLMAGSNGKPTTFYVYTIASLSSVDASVAALKREFFIIYPIILAVVAISTWILSRRALAPVDQIRRDVEEITALNLSNRVFQPEGDDEIARLAATMNSMLTRLDAAAEQQKQFIADASHELKSPLSALRASLEVGLLHSDLTDWQQTAGIALRESERMQRLIEDLLTLAKAEARVQAVRITVDLDELCREEVHRIRRTHPGVNIDMSRVSAVRLLGDPEQIRSIVRNLIENAVRYASTTVSVTASTTAQSAVFTVADDGPGIPMDRRDAIFERFTRLDPARSRLQGGSGLGLPIVRSLVELLGGTVTVESSEAGGAYFRVQLPVSVKDRVPSESTIETPSTPLLRERV